MTKNNNVPQIRFKGFTDTWEQRELGDISEKVTRKNQDIVCDEVLTNSAEYGIISQRDFFDKDIANSENIDGYYIVEPNDFVYNPRISTLAPFGPIRRNKLGKSGAMSPLYYVFRTHDVDYGFLEYYFKTNCWYSFMHLNGNSGARSDRFAIRDDIFKEMPITIPQDIVEQQQIGDYFTNLDKVITLHQRKCETLKKLKKSMLQKMFPKNGKSIPEIRFAGFTDAWEQREFKNTFDFLQNNALSRAELSEEQGSAMNVHYGDILVKFGEVLDVSSEPLPYVIDEATVKKYSSSKLQNGDVIIADAAEDETVGKCTEIANLQDETVLAGLHTIPIRTKEKFSCGYLGYYMNSNSYHNQLLPLMQGTKVSSISKSAIQDTMILYPKSAEEQKQIGDYFRNLDHLITLHQRKLETLKKLKKSMLQKMFI